MSWCKFTTDEAAAEQVQQEIVEEFLPRFMKAGAPRSAAVFRSRPSAGGMVEIYFSPRACDVAGDVVTKWSAAPCSAPSKQAVDVVAGDQQAWELF